MSYDQFIMTDRILCKMTDHWVLNLKLLLNSAEIASKQFCQLEQVYQPQFNMLALAGTPVLPD